MFLAGETNGLWLPPGKSWKILPARPVTGNCSALKLAFRGESFFYPLWTTAAYISRTKNPGGGKWQTGRQWRDSWNSHTVFPTVSFPQRLCGRHRPWEELPHCLTQVPLLFTSREEKGWDRDSVLGTGTPSQQVCARRRGSLTSSYEEDNAKGKLWPAASHLRRRVSLLCFLFQCFQ